MQKIEVGEYSIYLGDVLEQVVELSTRYPKVAVLVDENTKEHCLPLWRKYSPEGDLLVIEIPSGEIHKNLETCRLIWDKLFEARFGRGGLLVNLGGGVIGDMGGFCASTYKRGMDFVQVPTTVLSQVDASVGGKLGIDYGQLKNSIGLFNDPKEVYVHTEFLKTLPPREIRSGFAEILKHALIRDADHWEELKEVEDLSGMDWDEHIGRSVIVKRDIVQIDPIEKGLRKALNFGHTIGHAVESVALESDAPLLHGEAVALGMVCESYISYQTTGLPADEFDAIVNSVKTIYGCPRIDDGDDAYLSLMRNDKKNKGGKINFSLLPRIGDVSVDMEPEESLIIDALAYYRSIQFDE